MIRILITLCWVTLIAVAVPVSAATSALSGADITPAKAKKIRRAVEPKARNGDANAQYNMGVLYANGYGVDKNLDTAMKWYRKAAKQHQAKAELNIGIMYATARGVARDMDQAARWFARAARDGEASAQNNLAVLYARGDGLPQDLGQAAVWAARATRAGNREARDNLKAIIDRLPDQYSQGDSVTVRSQPSAETHVVDRLTKGARVVRVDRRHGWSQVVLPETRQVGWIKSDLLGDRQMVAATASAESADSDKTASSTSSAGAGESDDKTRGRAVSGSKAKRTVAAGTVNVRDGPSRSATVAFRVQRGTQITIKRAWRGWRYAEFPNGRSGWIAGYLLTE